MITYIDTGQEVWTGNPVVDQAIQIVARSLASKQEIVDILGILGPIEDLAQEIIRGVQQGFSDLMSALGTAIPGGEDSIQLLADLLSGKWTKIDTHSTELADLQSKIQDLEGVVGYGQWYMNSTRSWNISSLQKMPYDLPIGPSKGCTLQPGGGVILGSRGLWRASAQTWFDTYLIGIQKIESQIRVYDPQGNLFATRQATDTTGAAVTLDVTLPFVIPTAGYRVEMWANASVGRGVLGGSNRNGFDVEKISSETS